MLHGMIIFKSIRFSLFWDFTHRRLVFCYWGFRTTTWYHLAVKFFLNCFILECESDGLNRNVDNRLLTFDAQRPRRSKASLTPRRRLSSNIIRLLRLLWGYNVWNVARRYAVKIETRGKCGILICDGWQRRIFWVPVVGSHSVISDHGYISKGESCSNLTACYG